MDRPTQNLQQEIDVTQQVLSRLRENPNSHIVNLKDQVESLSMKLEPMLQKVEQAQRNIELAKHPKNLSGQEAHGIGMLSKMGGRLMHYYADELSDMMLDDILYDTVKELQVIEEKERNGNTIHESKQMAENIM